MTVTQSVMGKLQSIRGEIAQREGKIQQLKAVEQVLFELANPVGGDASKK